MELEIVRYAYLPGIACLGHMNVANLRLDTLEEPWRKDPDGPGGQRREGALLESCVPDGVYRLVPHDGTKFKNVWCLVNSKLGVYRYPDDIPPDQKWGRSSVLIHAGNTTSDIMGCIAVGRRAGWELSKPFVYESGAALNDLRTLLGRKEHTLTIRPSKGTNEL